MSEPPSIELTPVEAARLIEQELSAATESLRASHGDTAQDRFVSALGIALQLGPVPVETVLWRLMRAIRELSPPADSEILSTLGPALIHLVGQVRSSGALPSSRVMEAWATVASDVGTIIGQVGLALSMEPDRRTGMMANARIRAVALDEATGIRFAMADWIDHLSGTA